jgi:Bacterial Ig-like domain (group 3)
VSARDGNGPSGEGWKSYMLAIRSVIRSGIRMRLILAVGLLVPGLMLAAGTGTAAAATSPGHTIASAGTLKIGSETSGGGGPIDFWKVHLNGGDKVQISAGYPQGNNYVFALYAPGTTDGSFPQAATFSAGVVNESTSKSVIDLQAPYNGTFILAVCQNVTNNNCVFVDQGAGTNPMNPYTFTPTLISGGVSSKVAAKETKASPTIAKAPAMGLGNFEAGGGGPIDFWKVHLNGGDKVQISAGYPQGNNYVFALYRPGTTDTSFPRAAAVSSAVVNESTSKSVLLLQAPSSGNFILAVCQNVTNNNCVFVDQGAGTNPMNPYTYSTRLTGGPETSTTLKLSSSTVTSGHEKSLSLSAAVAARFGKAVPSGTVTITAGKKKVCSVKLAKGKGKCSPSSNTLLAPGSYSLVASYGGGKGLASSQSAARKLTVKKG